MRSQAQPVGLCLVFLKFEPRFAPIKCGVFPLVNKDGMPEIAEKLSFAGTPDEVTAKIKEIEPAGVNHLIAAIADAGLVKAFTGMSLDGVATNAAADSGPHQRWSTGTLFDNITTNTSLNLQNRLNSGSGHGWAGANMVIWNSTAGQFYVQSPPTAQNWIIGSTAVDGERGPPHRQNVPPIEAPFGASATCTSTSTATASTRRS